jgi:6-phosphogluconolactonase/glucosamine-6-phosphate isomerase/deaminase
MLIVDNSWENKLLVAVRARDQSGVVFKGNREPKPLMTITAGLRVVIATESISLCITGARDQSEKQKQHDHGRTLYWLANHVSCSFL